MKTLPVTIIASAVVAFVSGCQTTRDEAALFKQKYPERARHYVLLEPQSLHLLIDLERLHKQTVQGIVDAVEKRKENLEELEKYLQRLRQKFSGAKWYAEYDTIKQILDEVGGTLYYFKWRCREFNVLYEHDGLMIIRDGEIVWRNGELAETIQTFHNPENGTEQRQ
jgi:hypothetical protein